MSLLEFITHILNVKSSDIEEATTLDQDDGSLVIRVRLVSKISECPICRKTVNIHGYIKRKITHSTFVNRECCIVYMQRRYRCPYCEHTFSEPNPFAMGSAQISTDTVVNILKDLKYPDATYLAVGKRYNISPTQVTRIFDKHVNIPRKTLPEVLSIDEHYFPNSDYGSKYCCLLMDFTTREMIDILPDRKKDHIVGYFGEIKRLTTKGVSSVSELNNVKYISIDMYEPYRDIAHIFFPKAKVCADSFHVIKHLTDDFRKVVLRCARSTEDDSMIYLLKVFRHVFDHNKDLDNEPKYNRRFGRYLNYRDIRDMMLGRFPELKVAYELKEYYINMNSTTLLSDAPEAVDRAIELFEGCGIDEYDEFYRLLNNWREEIVNSFTTINGQRINNSVIESKNRMVEKLIYNANGFTNFKRTRNRILYCLNPNDTFTL